ncbi:Starch-binding associating with outer membrane [Mucilaginibacter pineti]|uniref:Starch-binding associating with outer membrane n=1 Tax=Mucilaginibacter pineti TaxID=1391627 RepID=A0A1G7M4A5_9SPHI|nr:RagB/SusD family nutrient uptake outer membrane protein [Mucilaginibacter pineti]SDF56628.1 Starch-binding associating with outer membrane [Mucilaginibacter pineti]
MKHYYKICTLLIFAVAFNSCKKYLDVTPDNTATLDYAFQSRNEAENYLFACYSPLQTLSDVLRNPGFTSSAEIVIPDPSFVTYSNLGSGEEGFNLLKGTQNVVNPAMNYWDGTGQGRPMFEAIRRCNIFLENIDKAKGLLVTDKQRWVAEVKFLKAYYHYWLVRMYGPIPILRKSLPIDATTAEVRVKREPVDTAFNYVEQLLNEAIPNLPLQLPDPSSEFGRITRPIALAIKAEILATAASPQFNGNSDYTGFKGKDGINLFSTGADPQKWQKAMAACKAAIDTCEGLGMKLYKFIKPGNIGTITDQLNLVLTLQNAVTERNELNTEAIWALNPIFTYQTFALPRLTIFGVTQYHDIKSNFSAPMAIAQMFYTANGVPISEDKTWDYGSRYSIGVGDDKNSSFVENGYPTANLNLNREARYYANLGFDGGIWFGHGRTEQSSALYVQTVSTNGTAYAGPNNYININVTGYWPKKLVHYQTTYFLNDQNTVTEVGYRLPMMRLADLYLLYAEAINEVNGPTADAFHYIDIVRNRAGLQGVKQSWDQFSTNPGEYSSKEGLRKIIHQERRIELCFEGRVGWDLRRWKELESVLNVPIQGWNWKQTTNRDAYYTPQTLFQPVFNKRDYLWPISDNSLTVNPNLVQNPGW